MKITHAIGIIVVTGAATVGLATPAFAVTPQPTSTVDSTKVRINAKAAHIIAKLGALQIRIGTKPALAAAKATLQADITKALADTNAWRVQADAASTKEEIKACDPAHRSVKADLAKLHTDLAAAKGTKAKSH